MATIGWIRVGLSADAGALVSGLKKGETAVSHFASVANIAKGTLAGLGVAAGIHEAVGGFKSMITAASDLNENINKVKAIFGQGAAAIISESNAMAKAFGVSKNEFLDASSRMGGLFKGAGFAADATAALSIEFVKLAADASSFFNVDFSTAFDKLRSGLSGESEPLRDFGVFLTEDMVKAKAFSMGIAQVGSELTEQAKIQARAALIMDSLKDAQGDLARTSGEHAGRVRAFWGSLSNLGAELGQTFLPAATQVLGVTVELVGALNEWLQATGIASNLGTAFTAIANTVSFIVGGITAAIEKTTEWAKAAKDASGWLGTIAGFALDPLKGLKESFGIEFMGAKEALSSLGLTSKEEAKGKNGGANAAAVSKALLKPQDMTKGSAAGKLGAQDNVPRFASAAEFGSREAYSAILRSRATSRGQIQERLWRENKRTADGVQRLVQIMTEMQRRGGRDDGGLITTMQGAV